MPDKPQVFFGYPSQPELRRETLARGAALIQATGLVESVTWEQLSMSGRIIIDAIARAIDQSAVSAFDVTRVNHNVMFELGYAIGSNRRVWLLREPTDEDANRTWDALRTLTTIGYTAYNNSDQIRAGFLKDQPHLIQQTIYQTGIRPSLQPAGRPRLFLMPSPYDTDASRAISERVEEERNRGVSIVTADPTESSSYSLTWYAQQIYWSLGTVVQFSAEWRAGALVNNARAALICGLVHGMGRPLLMLAEQDYATPIDYRDLLFVYDRRQRAISRLDGWLHSILDAVVQALGGVPQPALDLGTELRGLRFGEDIAENEEDQLESYFVETGSYLQVLERETMVFLGRKGTGKTANLLRAAEALAADKRNLVCVIKPYNYELEAIVALLSQYPERDLRGYLVEGLWQYLLFTEIARAAVESFKTRPAGVLPGTPEWELARHVEESTDSFEGAFAVRLERAIQRLSREKGPGMSVEAFRDGIDERLHADMLRETRVLLGRALSDRDRVAVLVDNLDKAWDRSADLDKLSYLLLGLLSSIGRIASEFTKKDKWRQPVAVTLSVFLRSDIFNRIIRFAREPDKIPITRIEWENTDLLIRLLEERYAAGREVDDPSELWNRFFPASVRGVPIQRYLTSRVLPRPRDLLHLCNEAIVAAVNAGHPAIWEEDILAAERLYSQFALEALLVEDGISVSQLEGVLFEFAGSVATLELDQVTSLIVRSGIPDNEVRGVLSHLRALSFLGIEVREDEFSYAEDAAGLRKQDAMQRTFEEQANRPARLRIHPAYRGYLEVVE